VTRRRTARRAELTAALDLEGRRTGSLGTLHARAMADRAGVHQTDFEALDVLDWAGPISAGELAKRVGVTSGAITGVVDRLERDGWVRRVRDPHDRRRVIVEMVPDRIDLEEQAAMFGPLIADIAAVNDRYDDDQLAAILEYLRACNDAIERSTARLRQPPGA
jgi:DNA-binding MarR family transcriptional regulator